jgi:Tol biopolymer transport system component
MCPLPHFYWNGMISHQIWGRTPREVLIDATWRGRGAEYVVFDERTMPLQATRISRGMGPASHLIFSPDGSKMLADSYPDSFGFQQLGLVDVATGGITRLGRFRHFRRKGYCGDTRCDLHPRWSPDGKTVTVDSIHDGRRGIYMLEL